MNKTRCKFLASLGNKDFIKKTITGFSEKIKNYKSDKNQIIKMRRLTAILLAYASLSTLTSCDKSYINYAQNVYTRTSNYIKEIPIRIESFFRLEQNSSDYPLVGENRDYFSEEYSLLNTFKKAYIQKYNYSNSTCIQASEICFSIINYPYIYMTYDGQIVTPGNGNGQDVEMVLRQYGPFYKIDFSETNKNESEIYRVAYKDGNGQQEDLDICVAWYLKDGSRICSSAWSGCNTASLLNNLYSGSNYYSVLLELYYTPYTYFADDTVHNTTILEYLKLQKNTRGYFPDFLKSMGYYEEDYDRDF